MCERGVVHVQVGAAASQLFGKLRQLGAWVVPKAVPIAAPAWASLLDHQEWSTLARTLPRSEHKWVNMIFPQESQAQQRRIAERIALNAAVRFGGSVVAGGSRLAQNQGCAPLCGS